MIEVKTAELIGAALDWAVAKAEDVLVDDPTGLNRGLCMPWKLAPSTDWAQGGPLIEKYLSEIHRSFMTLQWRATSRRTEAQILLFEQGPTPLIAAYRAIVAVKLGCRVQAPSELT